MKERRERKKREGAKKGTAVGSGVIQWYPNHSGVGSDEDRRSPRTPGPETTRDPWQIVGEVRFQKQPPEGTLPGPAAMAQLTGDARSSSV